jgi:hypothetical protein
MELIAHRVNTIEELRSLPREYGVEIDLRDYQNRLIIQHDPFMDGVDFEDYLQQYQHGTLILNIKSERIEFRVKELICEYNIKDYFFLDSSFPMINSLINSGESNVALRFSEFESLETILNLVGKVRWVWVDCFSYLPLNKENYQILKDAKFKICLVSPELQMQPEKLVEYRDYLCTEEIELDAVCTKISNFKAWL